MYFRWIERKKKRERRPEATAKTHLKLFICCFFSLFRRQWWRVNRMYFELSTNIAIFSYSCRKYKPILKIEDSRYSLECWSLLNMTTGNEHKKKAHETSSRFEMCKNQKRKFLYMKIKNDERFNYRKVMQLVYGTRNAITPNHLTQLIAHMPYDASHFEFFHHKIAC